MNWRLATLINAGIAAVTLVAVAYDFSHERSREPAVNLDSPKNNAQSEAQRRNRLLTPGEDLTEMRVDDLAVVPPAELYDIFFRASPEQIAKIALKFNDLPKNSHATGAILIFFQAWAELDPTHALEGAFRLKDMNHRTDAVNVVTGSASPAAAAELAKALADHPDDLTETFKGKLLAGLLEKWAWVDPTAAASFLSEVKGLDEQVRLSAAGNIAGPWATVDPKAALAWVDRLGKSDEADAGRLFASLIDGWYQADPNAARRYVSEHLDRPGAEKVATAIGNILLNENSETAAAFLRNLPAGETKESVEGDFARNWATKDPVAAVQWLEKLPEKDQSAIVDNIVGVWSTKDWPAASKWVAGLTGNVRDLAIASAVGRAPDDVSPSEYLPLVLSIKDDQARNSATEGVVAQWAQRDPEAAVAWVKNSGLPKDEKQGILAMPAFSQQQSPE